MSLLLRSTGLCRADRFRAICRKGLKPGCEALRRPEGALSDALRNHLPPAGAGICSGQLFCRVIPRRLTRGKGRTGRQGCQGGPPLKAAALPFPQRPSTIGPEVAAHAERRPFPLSSCLKYPAGFAPRSGDRRHDGGERNPSGDAAGRNIGQISIASSGVAGRPHEACPLAMGQGAQPPRPGHRLARGQAEGFELPPIPAIRA